MSMRLLLTGTLALGGGPGTQGDIARSNTHGYTHAWGYLPATAASQGGQNQPVPGVPRCATYY